MRGVRLPWANTVLLVLLGVEAASGVAGLLGGTGPFRIASWAHAVGAYALVLVLFAKAHVVLEAVRRRPGWSLARALLLLTAALLGAVVVTGLVWITAGRREVLGVSLVNLHAYLAIALVLLVAPHALRRRGVVRVPRAADRAAFLRLGGLAVAGVALWQIERLAQELAGTPGSRRRFTGSYEVGSLGGEFPRVIWLNDTAPRIAPADYRLRLVGGAAGSRELTHAELRALPAERETALLDCTGGWFTRQVWVGPRLGRLLELAGLDPEHDSVEVVSATGYARRFAVEHARGLMLATHVAGRPLSAGHGFPARLVVPGRRGFDWVKWVAEVRLLGASHLLQPPLPLS